MKLSHTRRSLMFAAGILLSGFALSSAQADTLDNITTSGVLTVGVFQDFPPFSSVDTEMNLRGYDIDVAELIADKLKVKLKLVTITGQNRIPLLNARKVDILLSVGYSDERAKVIDYTKAYAPYYVAVIGPKAIKVENIADLAGKSIAVNRGTLEDTLTSKLAPEADIKRFDNYNGVIQAFLTGQAQLMVVGNTVGAQILGKQVELAPEQKLHLNSSPDHIGVNKGEPRLKKIIDETIEEALANGKMNEISIKWLKKPLNPEELKD